MVPCSAETAKYDHDAATAKMSDEEKWEILLFAQNQYRQALNNNPIDCAGIDRERKRLLIYMFRCFFCGRYFCPQCSKEHFGRRFTDNRPMNSGK
jgi:hypothetical protein